MLEIIKAILMNTQSNRLADYYQARLQSSDNIVEIEAILSMNTLLSFNETALQSEVLNEN
ncbi:hypothetical protein [Psychromonas sp. Urea-02u-13]|uniref:hypothetical protein n=1 Tax=Psychromonas sp. Urea-02u-13 TaxID=2058326 RepID=UPI000C33755C|nr:hypothetical protein [Psychromonas sp. Urea-02u-13]PKG39790.1 hypothetical protein CXF74_06440 [Psychromonas sp. Urea-02u-13]